MFSHLQAVKCAGRGWMARTWTRRLAICRWRFYFARITAHASHFTSHSGGLSRCTRCNSNFSCLNTTIALWCCTMCETVISYIAEVGYLYSNTERREVKSPGNVAYQLNLLMRTKCLCKSWRLWNECLTRQSTVITTTVSNEYVGLMLSIENQFVWGKNMAKRDVWWVREMNCHNVKKIDPTNTKCVADNLNSWVEHVNGRQKRLWDMMVLWEHIHRQGKQVESDWSISEKRIHGQIWHYIGNLISDGVQSHKVIWKSWGTKSIVVQWQKIIPWLRWNK